MHVNTSELSSMANRVKHWDPPRYAIRLLRAARGDTRVPRPASDSCRDISPVDGVAGGTVGGGNATPLWPPAMGHPPPLRAFPLRSEHIGTIRQKSFHHESLPPSPSDFHSEITRRINSAEKRVKIATLYIGSGGSGTAVCGTEDTSRIDEGTNRRNVPKEAELLDAIELASSKPGVEVAVLMDLGRGTRIPKKGGASSADVVKEKMDRGLSRRTGTVALGASHSSCEGRASAGLYLFPVLPSALRSILPSPLNEVGGVFHLKAYIMDDALILSGANLSEDYFTNRRDRYMLFQGGKCYTNDFPTVPVASCTMRNSFK